MKKSSPTRASGPRKPSKKQSALGYKWQMMRWRWGRAARSSRLVVFAALFGLVGVATLLYSFAAETTPRMPTGANQIVLSYQHGMPHTLIEGEFAQVHDMPSMLLYGDGLMLCSQGQEGHDHSEASELPTVYQRQLDRKSLQTVFNQVKSKGFYDLTDQEQTGEYIHPIGTSRSILLNTTKGASMARVYSGDDSPQFVDLEQYLQEECAQATNVFDPDDIVVETIKTDDSETDKTLPAGVPSDGELKKNKSRHVTGAEAKELKTKLTKQTQIFKANDGSIIKARYVPKTPEYAEPLPLEESQKGKVSAATTSNVRWFYVLASDQQQPSNAHQILKEHADTVLYYYSAKVGKSFTNVDIRVMRGAKTAAQYRVCPTGVDCQGKTSLAIYYNMQNEFKGGGYNTNILHSFDKTDGCMGWGGNSGGDYNTIAGAWGFAVSPLAGCNWYDGSHHAAAHEGGHGFSLPHTCDSPATLMNGYTPTCPSPGKTIGLNGPINANQVSFLKNSSPFFNQISTTKPVITLKANGTTGNITVNTNTSLTISWSATGSPYSCVASGNWSGSKPASGSENRTADTYSAGTKSYTLVCSNPAGATTTSRIVTVSSTTTSPPTSTTCNRQINFIAPTPNANINGPVVKNTETSTEWRQYYYQYYSPTFSSHQIQSISPSNTSYYHSDVSGQHGIVMNYTPYFQAGYNPAQPTLVYNYYYNYTGRLYVRQYSKSTGALIYNPPNPANPPTGDTSYPPIYSSATYYYTKSMTPAPVYSPCN